MLNLSKFAFERACNWIQNSGRELEKSLLQFHFFNGPESEVIELLAAYQNQDGGFGNGLEADIRLPYSSAIATTVALQQLMHLRNNDKAKEMIDKTISYFENTYDEQRGGWFAVPEEVNNYPHAFWWKVHENGMSWIDFHWGNPSAEIIGYLYCFQSKLKKLNMDELMDRAIKHLLELEKFESEHEIYCYIRLFQLCPEFLSEQVNEQLHKAVSNLVQLDVNKWAEYVPFPLKFVNSPSLRSFGLSEEEVNKNLDYFIEKLENDGKMEPPWSWNDYLSVWEIAKQEWTGVLTLEALLTLKRYKRIHC